MNIQSLLKDFFESIDPQCIYNEASVQFELGWFLRSKLPNWKIYLEKNISQLELTNNFVEYVKKEIDLLLCNGSDRTVIEIKAPINQREARSVTVFEFIKDIHFLSSLRKMELMDTRYS